MIGLIYKITDNTNSNVYYGSTTQTISQRMKGHRDKYKAWVGGKRRNCKSFDIIKNADYSYSLVEQVEFENKMELLQRERFWIENNECVNKCIPIRSQDEKIEYKREYQKEYDKQYREKIREYQKEYQKEYEKQNRGRLNERKKQYRARKKLEKLNLIII
jgi:hypothetical protein